MSNLHELTRSVLRDFESPRGGVNERIELDIRRHRMAWQRIQVTDSAGNPCKGVTLRLSLKKHEFLFGCNTFKWNDFENQEHNRMFEDYFTRVFNHGTIAFLWDTFEPEQGKPRHTSASPRIARRPPTDELVDWCLRKGITPKGHWLFCDNFIPEWVPKDGRALMVLLEQRIADLAARYGKTVPIWDVVNEAFSNPRWFHPSINWSVTPQDYVYSIFRLAEKYFPNSTELCYNDGNHIAFMPFHFENSPMHLLARGLQDRGARLGSLGMQFHMYGILEDFVEQGPCHGYFDPVHQFRVLDQYARLGIPLHITEISLPTFPELPRQDAERLQADMLRFFYRLWFSHPSMESIVWWNLCDKTAFGSESQFDAGLIGPDMQEKPAFHALDELVNREWHTECCVVTNEQGIADWNGFHGEYALEIQAPGFSETRTVSLSRHAADELRMVIPS